MTLPTPDVAPPLALLGWPAGPSSPALEAGARVHLVGIGGAGMSGLARALHARGLAVSGTDRDDGPELAALRTLGIDARASHAADLPAGCALVVPSPAIPGDNAELRAAHAAGVPIVKRAALLGALSTAPGTCTIAVAGTHGKSTTSGLVAWVLTAAGRDPSYFIGAHVRDLGSNARVTPSADLVVEADEYDRTFLALAPAIAIITHLELDHPDQYADDDAFVGAFADFARNVAPSGRLIAWAAAERLDEVAAACPAPLERYAVAGDVGAEGADWRATIVASGADGQTFDVAGPGGALGRFTTVLHGRHAVANALAAIAVAEGLGIDRATIRRAVAGYRGVARRFGVRAIAGGVTVVDDYAHHPTEIAATLDAAAARWPGAARWAVVEPHTHARFRRFADRFAPALGAADHVVLTPVHAARREPVPDVSAAELSAAVPRATLAASLGEAARFVARGARPGDVALFMGAGAIRDASAECVDLLRAASAERLMAAAAEAGLEGDRVGAGLAEHTSLRVGGPADAVLRVRHTADLAGWVALARRLRLPVRVLGRGSNVLVSDAGFGGLVLVNRCEAWAIEAEDPATGTARVRAESGVSLASLARQLARAGWAGIEAGVGIPGSVGASVVTNAGAHGWSMADSVESVLVLEPDGTERRIEARALGFGYRTSALKGDPDRVVLHATLRVAREEPAAIAARMAGFAEHRRTTQPAAPSVGSMFKNPPGDHAGRLIEAAGLKGAHAGGARISPIHANFFVNEGGATSRDVHALIARAKGAVLQRFGIALELEIEPLGLGDGDPG